MVVHFVTPYTYSALCVARPAPSKTVSDCLGASPYSARVYVAVGVVVLSKMFSYVS